MIDPKTAEEWKAQAERLLGGMAAGHMPIPATAVARECCRRVLDLLAEVDRLRGTLEDFELIEDPETGSMVCPACWSAARATWPTPDSTVEWVVEHESNCRLAAALKGTP